MPHQTTNNCSHVENTPEPSKVSSLLTLSGVRDHDSTLGSPEKTGTATQKSACENVEALHICVLGGQERDGINAVSDSTK